MMPAVYEYPLTVEPEEIDRLGHVNNLSYLAWMQRAALAHSAAQGWPPERYEELGAGWVVRSHEIRYLQPAYAGQNILVRTWVAGMKRVGSTRRYRIEREGQLLARTETHWAFITLASGAPCKIPPQVLQAFELFQEEAA